MVLRSSNGVAFVVLEPEPSVRTGIRVEIYDGANPNTLLDVLQDSFGREWTDPLKGPGLGRFTVYATDPKLAANPDLLAYGNVARFYLDGVARFAITIEHKKRTIAGEGEDAARAIEVSGRGALAKLEEAQVYRSGGLSGDVERLFTTNAGDEVATLVDEAHARGALAGITYDFTTAVDSNNAPWAVPVDQTERAGTDYLRVVTRLGDLAADFRMSPALVLQAFNTRGLDRSAQLVDAGPVVLQLADNIADAEIDEDGAIRNVLLIETPTGWLERAEGASVAAHRRREAFLSLGNVTSSDQVDRAADAVFERSANPASAPTLRVLDKDGHRPYVDWNVGDWVQAPNRDGDLDRQRVRALTVTETDEGQPVFVPELATILEELEERLERWLAAMARGTMGGTAGTVAEPVKAPAEVVEAVASGLDDHVTLHPHPDELADLADVDFTTLADADLLTYDAAAGDWVPVPGTKDDGDVPTVQADGSVAWEVPPAGGGGGAVPAWVTYLAEPVGTPHAQDDEFDDESVSAAWTVVEDTSPNLTLAEGLDVLSVSHPGGDAAVELHGIMRAFAPAGDFILETAIKFWGAVQQHQVIGLIAADGVTYGAGGQIVADYNIATPSTTLRSFNGYNAQVSSQASPNPRGEVPVLFIRLGRVGTVWTGYFSPDGVSWLAAPTIARSLTISHVGLSVSTWGGANPQRFAFEYFRVTE